MKVTRSFISSLLFAALVTNLFAQESNSRPNIILMIGDGMGVTQIYAGLTGNHGTLNLEQFKIIGFSKTQSASNYITDSGASATAMSTGQKTYNVAIGLDADTIPRKTILEYAEENGMATGLVATSMITDATPASFISHQPSRYDFENIALDFLKTDIDVFIGGGRYHFAHRTDSIYLIDSLRAHGYQVVFSVDSLKHITEGKLAGLTAPFDNLPYNLGRKEMLSISTQTAINILNKNTNGFFLMIEGSHIDKEAHVKSTNGVVSEMIDFDHAIGLALDFAKRNGNTLVIVTADHETSGMNIIYGDFESGRVIAEYNISGVHTGVMVPVFAYGPGAEMFQGFQENTDLFFKMMKVLDIQPEDELEGSVNGKW